MHRRPLLELLDDYAARHPTEIDVAARIRRLVEAHADCFERTCRPGHVTSSAWIVSHDHRHFLLTHHRKLGRWLQLGGHTDGDPDVARSALREAREESGLSEFGWGLRAGRPLAIDLDVHAIPPHGDEPAHEHHDVRFLLVAGPRQALQRSDESNDLRWFPIEALERMTGSEESLRRLGRKAAELLARVELGPAAPS